MSAAGTWKLTIKTPVGSLLVDLVVTETDRRFTGLARGQGEDVVIPEIAVLEQPDGQHLNWTQDVTKPLRLTLHFDVLVAGDTMTGTARAGRLPASRVSGTRVTSSIR